MRTLKFNKDVKESDVWIHYDALISALQYHRKRGNDKECKAIREEIKQMQDAYEYIRP